MMESMLKLLDLAAAAGRGGLPAAAAAAAAATAAAGGRWWKGDAAAALGELALFLTCGEFAPPSLDPPLPLESVLSLCLLAFGVEFCCSMRKRLRGEMKWGEFSLLLSAWWLGLVDMGTAGLRCCCCRACRWCGLGVVPISNLILCRSGETKWEEISVWDAGLSPWGPLILASVGVMGIVLAVTVGRL